MNDFRFFFFGASGAVGVETAHLHLSAPRNLHIISNYRVRVHVHVHVHVHVRAWSRS